MFLNELWSFVKRNIFVIVLAVTLVIAAPWTLIFVLPIAIISLLPLFIKWRLYRAQKQMFDNMQNPSGNPFGGESQHTRKSKSDGEVTVVKTEQSEPRVNDEVGEYVDFKEIKDKK